MRLLPRDLERLVASFLTPLDWADWGLAHQPGPLPREPTRHPHAHRADMYYQTLLTPFPYPALHRDIYLSSFFSTHRLSGRRSTCGTFDWSQPGIVRIQTRVPERVASLARDLRRLFTNPLTTAYRSRVCLTCGRTNQGLHAPVMCCWRSCFTRFARPPVPPASQITPHLRFPRLWLYRHFRRECDDVHRFLDLRPSPNAVFSWRCSTECWELWRRGQRVVRVFAGGEVAVDRPKHWSECWNLMVRLSHRVPLAPRFVVSNRTFPWIREWAVHFPGAHFHWRQWAFHVQTQCILIHPFDQKQDHGSRSHQECVILKHNNPKSWHCLHPDVRQIITHLDQTRRLPFPNIPNILIQWQKQGHVLWCDSHRPTHKHTSSAPPVSPKTKKRKRL